MHETSMIIPLIIFFIFLCLVAGYFLFLDSTNRGIKFDPTIKEQTVQVVKKYFPPTVIQEQNVYYGSGAARGMVFDIPRQIPARHLVMFIVPGYESEVGRISVNSEDLYNRLTKNSAKLGFSEGKKKGKLVKLQGVFVDDGSGKLMINPLELVNE